MDPRYEYQAPKFVDFTQLGNLDDQNADSFFDIDMESGRRVSEVFAGKIDDDEGTFGEEKSTEVQSKETRALRPKNMVTSWQSMKIKSTTFGGGGGAVKNTTTVGVSVQKSSTAISGKIRKTPVTEASKENRSDPVPVVKPRMETPTRRSLRQAVAETVNNVRNSPHLKRLGTNIQSPRVKNQIDQSLSSATASRQRTRTRTRSKSPGMPQTPDVMRRFKNKMAAAVANAELKEDFKVKKSNLSRKENGPMKPSVQPAMKAPVLTKPNEFKFATSNRAKSSRRRSVSVPDAPDFTRMLRSYTKTQGTSAFNKEVTKPVPFPRAESRESRKRRLSEDQPESNKYKSMAEQINRFEKGTPSRFRSQPRGRSSSPQRSRLRSQSPAQKLTVPKTPQLSTKTRSRPNHLLSREEREALELEEAKKHQFHAKGVGETLPKFRYGEVERKPCTIPEPFHLSEFAKPFARPLPVEEKVEAFHSRPVNKKILQGPTGIPEKVSIPIIEPESPAFALKQRMAARRVVEDIAPDPERVIKAKPAPHYGVPVSLPPVSKHTTVPQPFSFSERDELTAAKKEERIKKLLEEEKAAREFHAHPIAKGVEHPKLPEKKVLPPTKAKPFRLAIEERVETRLNKWQEDINKELEEQRNAANFKASEPKVLRSAPFVPKPSEKPAVEFSNFTLYTDRRAEERMNFELERKKKEVDLEEMKRQREERKKREEEEEVARLRRQNVHKAQPIRGYKPVEIHPSGKPLTNPISPRLSSRSKVNSTFNKTGNLSQ